MTFELMWPLVLGAGFGLGCFVLVRALFPSRPSAAATVLRVDARARVSTRGNGQQPVTASASRAARRAQLRELLGLQASQLCARQGWEFPALRADLSLLGRSFESFMATKILVGLLGLVFGPAVFVALWAAGFASSLTLPLWLALVFAALFFFLPDIEVRGDAKKARTDFVHVLGSFTTLVANSLSGGRGLPEALKTATEITDTPPMLRLRSELQGARSENLTHWQALDRLGQEIAVPELRDLASRIQLAAGDGARIRSSLMSTAKTISDRELSAAEGKAGAQSQTMLIAQLSLVAGFMIFLVYPGLMAVASL
ncbi:type II secretion system F family protein [Streptomyces sp. NRRL B-24484]|uniref:type II secretion system F family protein n=1 Tax=Streptomyces sp. NRRL B-24484 TaxID=1463833 RepID=UPI0004C0EE9A|nr:type II secretion system F family protein [Streptomyces sp. NRRL B-24484]